MGSSAHRRGGRLGVKSYTRVMTLSQSGVHHDSVAKNRRQVAGRDETG